MRLPQLLLFLSVFICGKVTATELPRVALQTSAGTIVIELDSLRAPTTVDNFISYVSSGFYNDTLFHRVIDGFMIQGGGFTTNYMRKQTRSAIRNEANNGLRNQRYSVSMARTNAPHSATSQFFINTVDNPSLDHTAANGRGWGYAVFGRVTEGFDVVDLIGATPTGSAGPFPRDVPLQSIVIQSAALIEEEAATDNSAAGSDDENSGEESATDDDAQAQSTSTTQQ